MDSIRLSRFIGKEEAAVEQTVRTHALVNIIKKTIFHQVRDATEINFLRSWKLPNLESRLFDASSFDARKHTCTEMMYGL